MSILKKFNQKGSPLSNLNGEAGPRTNFKDSKLHNSYSINGIPNVLHKPSPSNLDLNGERPLNNYRDNSPEGRSF